MTLPLEDIVIIDLSRMLPGPYCSMILSDLGAEVIRVENRKYPYSNPPPFFQKGRYRESAFNSIIMRNKKSISINLKSSKGREIFYKLVKEADVVLETFRPKVVDKLKVDYKTLSKINQSLIYCSLTGYGQNGPYEQIAGHDLNYVGLCGILNLNRPRKPFGKGSKEQKPVVPGIQAGDIGGALISAIGILAALIERDKNPEKKGQYLDISMLDSVFSFMPMAAAYHFSKNLNEGIKTQNPLHGDMPYYSVYETKDGKYLSIGAIEMKFWHQFCKGLEREDLKTKQNVKGEERELLFEELQKEFLKKTQKEWMDIFYHLDACIMPVKDFSEACEDPQIRKRNMVEIQDHPKFGKIQNIASPIKMSRTPLKIRSLAPQVGENTEEILMKLGYSKEDLKKLKKEGAI
jgi:crotonobetainyl-CoA:carnitine CoA-transferase CaiB-like acyl-CoA transferase